MRIDKNKALKLRLAGQSYNEINKTLGVPKSTLSGWFTGLQLSKTACTRLEKRVHQGSINGLVKRNKNQTHLAKQRARRTRTEAATEIKNLTQNELKLMGVALYWAEGYKRPIVKNGKERTYHPVALANSDPQLIKLFLRFLREVCGVSDAQIMASIRIFEHMNEKQLMVFWQGTTGLPKKNFQKTYYGVSKSSKGKRPFNRLPYGTIAIRVNSTPLFHKIMGWIEGLAISGEHATIGAPTK
jgi:transcriptional regulator of acetoin/glycerol metabolism